MMMMMTIIHKFLCAVDASMHLQGRSLQLWAVVLLLCKNVISKEHRSCILLTKQKKNVTAS